MSVNVVVNFQASERNTDRLLALLREGRDLSERAECCEAFDLFQRQDDPHNVSTRRSRLSAPSHSPFASGRCVAIERFA